MNEMKDYDPFYFSVDSLLLNTKQVGPITTTGKIPWPYYTYEQVYAPRLAKSEWNIAKSTNFFNEVRHIHIHIG